MPPGIGYDAAKPNLKMAIKNAFILAALTAANNNNAEEGAGNDHQDTIMDALAQNLADAIHSFCLQAIVDTTTTGTAVGGLVTSVVATTGTPAAQAGTGAGSINPLVPAPTTGTGIGGCS